MASTPDELTINYSEGGIDVVKELDKEVLSKGAWTTILFRQALTGAAHSKKRPVNVITAQIRAGEFNQKRRMAENILWNLGIV